MAKENYYTTTSVINLPLKMPTSANFHRRKEDQSGPHASSLTFVGQKNYRSTTTVINVTTSGNDHDQQFPPENVSGSHLTFVAQKIPHTATSVIINQLLFFFPHRSFVLASSVKSLRKRKERVIKGSREETTSVSLFYSYNKWLFLISYSVTTSASSHCCSVLAMSITVPRKRKELEIRKGRGREPGIRERRGACHKEEKRGGKKLVVRNKEKRGGKALVVRKRRE